MADRARAARVTVLRSHFGLLSANGIRDKVYFRPRDHECGDLTEGDRVTAVVVRRYNFRKARMGYQAVWLRPVPRDPGPSAQRGPNRPAQPRAAGTS